MYTFSSNLVELAAMPMRVFINTLTIQLTSLDHKLSVERTSSSQDPCFRVGHVPHPGSDTSRERMT